MKNSKFFILLLISLLFCNSHANNKIRIKGLKGDDSHFNNNEIEKYVLLYTNYERKKNGLNELKWDDKLALAARKHSEEMSKLKYFSHNSPVSSNSTLEKRIANQGITTIMVGENIITEFTLNISGKSFYI